MLAAKYPLGMAKLAKHLELTQEWEIRITVVGGKDDEPDHGHSPGGTRLAEEVSFAMTATRI